MDVFRFGEDVSVPVATAGSLLRVSPLTGHGTNGSLHVAYLPARGRAGRRPAASTTLFAIVGGSGWVSGGDGPRRAVEAGYAVRWDAGEDHEVGTEVGLTAVVLEGTFDVWAMGVTRNIVVSDYDADWPDWFDQVAARVWPAVDGLVLRIDHVGSTSVPGLAAKPIIDLDVVVSADDHVDPVIERLAGIGYRWRGDLGVEGRQAFQAPDGGALPPHHLYLVVEHNRAHLDHVLLRDLLRQDPDARDRYAALKRANVDLAAGDMDVYVAAKAALVAELLARARAERGYPPVEYWTPDVQRPTPS